MITHWKDLGASSNSGPCGLFENSKELLLGIYYESSWPNYEVGVWLGSLASDSPTQAVSLPVQEGEKAC
jgi:hypothetical protein